MSGRQELIDRAKDLSRSIRKGAEYQAYLDARNQAYADNTTRALIDRYHRLQLKVQGHMLTDGKTEEKTLEELQKLGELLQFDLSASRLLMAEYTLRALMAEIYNALGSELDLDEPALYEEGTEDGDGEEKKEEDLTHD